MNDFMVCDCCGYDIWYDKESTLYLKCPCCDNVLIDVDIKESHLEPMTIVDYGIECKQDGEWMWAKCQDSSDYERTYWKKQYV